MTYLSNYWYHKDWGNKIRQVALELNVWEELNFVILIMQHCRV